MSDPTAVPFRDETSGLGTPAPATPSASATPAPAPASAPAPTSEVATGDPATDAQQLTASRGTPELARPAESRTDRLSAEISGPEDHAGMAELWAATMGLPHWWFVAVGDEGLQSPAAAEIDGQLMLLTFTDAERARHFAVGSGMIAEDEPLAAIALPPTDVVASAGVYGEAGIDGLMFDPQLAGYFIPTAQLPVVWQAVHSTDGPALSTQGEGEATGGGAHRA